MEGASFSLIGMWDSMTWMGKSVVVVLMLAAAWFVRVACAAFAWASVVEGSSTKPPAHVAAVQK